MDIRFFKYSAQHRDLCHNANLLAAEILIRCYELNKNENLLKIMLSNGVHDEDGKQVEINYPVSIIGESREHCIVMGGLKMNGMGKEIDVNV